MLDVNFLEYVSGAIMVVGATSFALGYMAGRLYNAIKDTLIDERPDFYAEVFKNADYGYCTCGGCGRVVPMKNNFEVADHKCDFSLAYYNEAG